MTVIFNGKPHEIADRATIADVLAKFELTSQRVAVEVNLELVPRGRHPDYVLRDGDRLEVVTLVGGG